MVIAGGSRGAHQDSVFRGVCCRVVDQLLWAHVRGDWGNIMKHNKTGLFVVVVAVLLIGYIAGVMSVVLSTDWIDAD